jgi:hypothetical protein
LIICRPPQQQQQQQQQQAVAAAALFAQIVNQHQHTGVLGLDDLSSINSSSSA